MPAQSLAGTKRTLKRRAPIVHLKRQIFPPEEGVKVMVVFGVLVGTTFPLFKNYIFAHDLPQPLGGNKVQLTYNISYYIKTNILCCLISVY